MNYKKIRNLLLLTFFIFLFQGCAVSQNSIQSIAQTNSATQIANFRSEVLKDLSEYKKKIDLRNPYAYNKDLAKNIYFQIDTKQDYINMIQDGYKLETANEYLFYAFSQEKIKNRNDFLIIGMYKLIYKAFSLHNEHQFAASAYNKKYMQELYTYLQVIRWKVRNNKDFENKYLFVTWQNNWQLEAQKKNITDLNKIKESKYIKSNEENIYSHSNFSFETLLERMLVNVKYSLRKIDVEPYEMGASALKSFVFII